MTPDHDIHLQHHPDATGRYFVHFTDEIETGLETIGKADVAVADILPDGTVVIAALRDTAQDLHQTDGNGIEELCAEVEFKNSIPSRDGAADQYSLVTEFLNGDGPRWLCWLDGARYDYFADLYPDYLHGDLTPAYNGGHGYTGDWTTHFLDGDYPDLGLFSPVPLWGFDAADYDERDHFGIVPDPSEYDEADVGARLAALGYRDHADAPYWYSHSDEVNTVVRAHLDDVTGGVVRYCQPHTGGEKLRDLMNGDASISGVRQALDSGDLTHDELHAAYRQSFQGALDGLADLIPDLPGEVVITADHGECLADDCCNQIFHARYHTECPCLNTVPWFRVEGVRP